MQNYRVCVCVCVCACGCVPLVFSAWKALFQLKVFDPAARRDRPARRLAGGRRRCLFAPLLGVSVGDWCVIQCQACGPTQDISPIIAACSLRLDPCRRCERAGSQPAMDWDAIFSQCKHFWFFLFFSFFSFFFLWLRELRLDDMCRNVIAFYGCLFDKTTPKS